MNYIVDDIGTVVSLMQADAQLIESLTTGLPALSAKGYQTGMPYYIYGHRVEIVKRLTEMDQDKVRKYKKYPLVALKLDTPEKNDRGMIDFTLNIALIMLTDRSWNAEERYVNVFKPILYPMYESFMLQLVNSGLFTWEGLHTRPKHTKIDRPYWGVSNSEGNTANYFADPLDAVELIDLQLTQTIKC